ncbi:MAG: nucleoside triphosphate pyrophosphohydrolase [Deferrisomatales bacterium]
MLPNPADTGALFLRLLEIVETLRSPNGCPWDREQTPATIAPYLVEEAHEVLEAVEAGDRDALCEELGDVLLEVALLAQMARERQGFTAADVLRSICDKLVRRHPHVFGGEPCPDAEAVKASWARIKAREKRGRGVLDGVPRRLPALHRARRVSEKAAGVGFDWADPAGVLEKVEEELQELRGALDAGDRQHTEEELGDVLFALVNLGRHVGVDPEAALHRTTVKFLERFRQVEEALARRGRHPAESTLEEMEALWQRAKAPSPAPEPPAQEPEQARGVGEPEQPGGSQVGGGAAGDQPT